MRTFYETSIYDLGEDELHDITRHVVDCWKQFPDLHVDLISDITEQLQTVFALNYTTKLMNLFSETQLNNFMEMYDLPLKRRAELNDCIGNNTYTDYSPGLILQYIRQDKKFLYHKNIYGSDLATITDLHKEGKLRSF